MKQLEEESGVKKNHLNSHLESEIYKDLYFLKTFDGPFTTADEVQQYIDTVKDTPTTNKHLHIEVCYVKYNSLT